MLGHYGKLGHSHSHAHALRQKNSNKKGETLTEKMKKFSDWKTQINQKNTRKLNWYVLRLRGLSQSEENKCLNFIVFTSIYSHFIEKDLCRWQNISVKFPFALLVYLFFSSGDILIFFGKSSPFYSYLHTVYILYLRKYNAFKIRVCIRFKYKLESAVHQ